MSEEDMFYCSFVSIHYIICECGETFPTEDALKIHLEKEHPHKKERKEYKCGVCESIFPTEQQCIAHYESTHIDVKQEHDYVERDEESTELEYEYYQEHETRDTIYRVVCEVCGQLYYENCSHECPSDTTKKFTPYKIQRLKKDYKTRPKKVVCEVCGKHYASNAALRYHQRVHTGERPYKCSVCEKSFTMPLFLQIHIRTHTGERPYKCQAEGCAKAFSNKAALLRHDRVHTGAKPYECPQCGKAFTQSNSMKLHVHTVHMKLPTPYKSKNRLHMVIVMVYQAVWLRAFALSLRSKLN
ncbi:hypothetical protein O3G_MSEX013884 [Manduca sexta]|uniref:C2H2-type domain-containing protein n=1 Tax=Manduca sexta TaxID=7130 RepID=A0A922CXM3_MANSE|nr:hypothetical protein O3G_MSEX013884 [Manduca sexta]